MANDNILISPAKSPVSKVANASLIIGWFYCSEPRPTPTSVAEKKHPHDLRSVTNLNLLLSHCSSAPLTTTTSQIFVTQSDFPHLLLLGSTDASAQQLPQ